MDHGWNTEVIINIVPHHSQLEGGVAGAAKMGTMHAGVLAVVYILGIALESATGEADNRYIAVASLCSSTLFVRVRVRTGAESDSVQVS